MMANGKYPLGITKVENKEKNDPDTNIRKAANRLIKFEQKLLGKDRKRKRNDTKKEEEEEKVDDNVIHKTKKRKLVYKNEIEDEQDDIIKGRMTVNKKKEKASKKVVNENSETIEMRNQHRINDVEDNLKKKTKKDGVKATKQIIKRKKSVEKNNKHETSIIDNIECVFERNSGTWVVFDVSNEPDEALIPNQLGACIVANYLLLIFFYYYKHLQVLLKI